MNSPNKVALPITLRRADLNDANQVVAGINSICTEGGAFYTTRYLSTPEWDGVLYAPEDHSDHILSVAEWNNQIVGAGRLFRGGKETLFNHIAELGMFVLKPFRRQQVGARLLDFLINWAIQEGIEKISLAVFETNQPAIGLYNKFGFIQEGKLNYHIKIDDQYTDLLLMGLLLNNLDNYDTRRNNQIHY